MFSIKMCCEANLSESYFLINFHCKVGDQLNNKKITPGNAGFL